MSAPTQASELTLVVLCGGRGTRAWPLTEDVPRPLLSVGDRPVLAHVLEIYAPQGVRRFVLAAGYRSELVRAYAPTSGYDTTTLDTGLDANTGEPISACLDVAGPTFFATYGDGLGNVALRPLLETHAGAGGATVTTVPLRSQYGTVVTDPAGRVTGFTEKPVLPDHWINAGYFVFDRSAYARHVGAGADLERDVLPSMASGGMLSAHRHRGFCASMDTQKDVVELGRLAQEGSLPWLDLPEA